MAVARPGSWYPQRCQNGHEQGPGLITASRNGAVDAAS
jgi:hypothetical protein